MTEFEKLRARNSLDDVGQLAVALRNVATLKEQQRACDERLAAARVAADSGETVGARRAARADVAALSVDADDIAAELRAAEARVPAARDQAFDIVREAFNEAHETCLRERVAPALAELERACVEAHSIEQDSTKFRAPGSSHIGGRAVLVGGGVAGLAMAQNLAVKAALEHRGIRVS